MGTGTVLMTGMRDRYSIKDRYWEQVQYCGQVLGTISLNLLKKSLQVLLKLVWEYNYTAGLIGFDQGSFENI